MVYGTQITIVFMGFINQLSYLGGPHIVGSVEHLLLRPRGGRGGDSGACQRCAGAGAGDQECHGQGCLGDGTRVPTTTGNFRT